MSAELATRWVYREDVGFRQGAPVVALHHYLMALLVCANGDGQLTAEEREWVVGRCAALRGPDWLIDTLQRYPANEDIATVIGREEHLPKEAPRSLVFDAFRACAADGDLSPAEVQTIRKMAKVLGVPDEVVTQLGEQFAAEQALRQKRLQLIWPEGVPF